MGKSCEGFGDQGLIHLQMSQVYTYKIGVQMFTASNYSVRNSRRSW